MTERPATHLLAGEEAHCLPEELPLLADGLPCKAVRSLSEKDARLVLASLTPLHVVLPAARLAEDLPAARVEGERIKRACCSPEREGTRRARQLACMHEARCSLPNPLPAHRLRHASPSELGACHGLSPSSSCSQLAGPVLTCSPASELGARLLAGFRARCSPARRLLIVLTLVAARGHHYHQAVRSLPASRP
ncbi:hypothetical protein Dimus_016834 [Dionaea muscipula]